MPLWLDDVLTPEEQDEIDSDDDEVAAALDLLDKRGVVLVAPPSGDIRFLVDQGGHEIDLTAEGALDDLRATMGLKP